MTAPQHDIILVDVLSEDAPRIADASEPFLYPDDLGAVRGDGVFETLLVRDGHACNVARHENRFLSSAEMLQLPAPDLDRWRAASGLAVDEWNSRALDRAASDGASADGSVTHRDASMRWVYSRGRESTGLPTGYIMITPAAGAAEARERGVRVMLAERGFELDLGNRAPWALIGAKTLSYAANMAALRYAKEHGFDDVIFTSSEGNLLEGPTSTIILVRGPVDGLVAVEAAGNVARGVVGVVHASDTTGKRRRPGPSPRPVRVRAWPPAGNPPGTPGGTVRRPR